MKLLMALYAPTASRAALAMDGYLRGGIRELTVDEPVPCHPYEYKWIALTSKQKDAARALGYNSRKWDNSSAPEPSAIRHDYWDNPPDGERGLTSVERSAATLLGYNEGSWEDLYENFDWVELPTGVPGRSDNENVKRAAKQLGFNRTTWDSNATSPTTGDLYWANLTETEKEAAEIIGYNECLWNRDTNSTSV
mmetsp:Transcript_25761/g.52377  ORF Transcript_25761/g.52377 Transcript_25761/m.52377 type:complete len:194 (-) Transcript_25761:1482-2063(-)